MANDESAKLLSGGQLFALLLFSGLFPVLTMRPAGALTQTLAAAPLFAAARWLIAGVLCRIVAPRCDALLKNRLFRAAVWLIGAATCIQTAASLGAFLSAGFRVYPAVAACAAVLVVGGVTAYQGLRALGRGSVLLLWLAGAALAALLLSGWDGYDVLNLNRSVLTFPGAMREAARMLLSSAETLALPLLLPCAPEKARRAARHWQGSDLLLRLLLPAAAMLLLGAYAELTAYPVFAAVSGAAGLGRAAALAVVSAAGAVRAALFLQLCCWAWRGGISALPKGKTAVVNTALAAACTAALLLTGCSAGEDIAGRAVVSAVYITDGERLSCTVECLEQRDAEEQEYARYSGEGATFADALSQIQRREGLDLYLAGCRWLAVSNVEDRAALFKVLRAIDADGRLMRGVRVAAAGADTLPAEKTQSAAALLDEALGDTAPTLSRALELTAGEGRGLLLPAVAADGKRSGYLSLNGASAALFPAEIAGVFAQEGGRGQTVTVGNTDLLLEHWHIRITPLGGEPPAFRFAVTARAALCDGAENIDEAAAQLEALLEAQLRNLLETAVISGKNDIFSLGRRLALLQGDLWQQYAGNWEETLPELRFSVEVRAAVRPQGRLLLR